MATARQISALKYLIANSKDSKDILKQLLFYLIDGSNGLTEEVSLTLTEGQYGYTKESVNTAAYGLGNMTSCGGSTHLDAMMKLAGVELNFSVHYGHYEAGKLNTEGMFPGYGDLAPGHENDRENMPLRYTFWLARGSYGHTGQGKPLVTPSLEELSAIDLKKTGLYPALEASS